MKCGPDTAGEPFSHMDELKPLIIDGDKFDYKLFKFETCESEEESKLLGIRFVLVSESDPKNKVELTPVGRMEGWCVTMQVDEYEI